MVNYLATPPIDSTVGSRPLAGAVSVFMRGCKEHRLITNVYVDGLNLYYRALKGTPFKWLNLRQLTEGLFPDDAIQDICYFTSLIHSRNDPGPPQRQLLYLRALHTLSGLRVFYGELRGRTKVRPLANPVAGLPDYVTILDTEEKGTDVNLAMRLLVDGFTGAYEQAVVVTNDSDLAGPVRYVRDELKLRTVVVNPSQDHTPKELAAAATYIKRLRRSHLRHSLFPSTLSDAQGVITKPPGW